MVKPFLKEESGQAGAADMLFFALLISISIVIMNVGPLTYGNSQQAVAFEDRYIRDYVESSVLTMKYVVADTSTSGEAKIKYTIGPGGDLGGVVSEISNLLKYLGFDSLPIERKVRGSVLDMMADDVVLNIRYDFNGRADGGYIKLSQLMATDYSSKSGIEIKKALDLVLGDRFNYFVVVEYHPSNSDMPALWDFVYGVKSYTNYKPLKDKEGEWEEKFPSELNNYLNEQLLGVEGLKVIDIPLTVSNDPDFLFVIIEKGVELFEYMWNDVLLGTVSNFFDAGQHFGGKVDNEVNTSVGGAVAGAGSSTESFFGNVTEEVERLTTINTRATARIYVWSRG
jgi:hypothetical protein